MNLRTVESLADFQAFFDTICLAYSPNMTNAEKARDFANWHGGVLRRAPFVPTTVRGAFLDSLCVGTYQMGERVLCIGPARLRAGCIGYVGTHPDFQRQGIASMMVGDAIAVARQKELDVLLLVGIPNFYARFGFTPVADYSLQVIQVADVATQPASPYRVRPLREADSDGLHVLYQRDYLRFERDPWLHADFLRVRREHNTPWVACDADDQPQGYLWLPSKLESGYAREVWSTSWPATLALLQHHAAMVGEVADPPTELLWPQPIDRDFALEVADYLPVQWRVLSVPDGEWMGFMPDLPRFVRLMESAWRERWQRSGRIESGQVTHWVGDFAFTLEMRGYELRLLGVPVMDAPTLRLHPTTFLRLIFGWRSVAWAMRQPGAKIPADVVPLAEALYPMDRLWFPPSDQF